MFGRRIRLFKLFGFEVKVDLSWAVIVLLVVWSLSTGFFPFQYKDLAKEIYWVMGVIGALGLFLSIIIHEFAHSLVATSYGMPMKGITLFIFGGVAEMGDEPPNAKAEFMMSVVGPLSSLGLAILFWAIHFVGSLGGWPVPFNGVMNYLAFINLLLAVFNLLPAFPLDGGRILRSILWHLKGDLNWATRISSGIGSFFGIFLVAMGFWRMFYGNLIGGMWMTLIGMFLYNAAKMSYQQLIMRKALTGEPVKRFMSSNPVTVPPSVTIEKFVEDYVYRYHFKMFPVVESGRLLGCASVKRVREIPRNEWGVRTVSDLSQECSSNNTVGPETDSMKAISIMNRTGLSRLMVVEEDRLVGIVSLKDLFRFLSDKVELEG